MELAKKYPSLIPALQNHEVPILGLYFAAGWCPDCTAATPFVKEAINPASMSVLDLVYVSSDTSQNELDENIASNWDAIPFAQTEERATLKVRYGVCAQKEMEGLGMTPEQRKYGIPTLILIDKTTGNVLVDDAIPDIMGDTRVDNPLSKWKVLIERSA